MTKTALKSNEENMRQRSKVVLHEKRYLVAHPVVITLSFMERKFTCKEKTRFRPYLTAGEGRGLEILVVGFFHYV